MGKLKPSSSSKSSTPTHSMMEGESATCSTDENQETTQDKNRPTTRRRMAANTSEKKCDFDAFKDEMRKMMSDLEKSQSGRLDKIEGHVTAVVAQVEAHVKDSKSQFDQFTQDLGKSVGFLSEQINIFKDKLNEIDIERELFANQAALFSEKLENMERFSFKTSVEIRNVPKKPKESKESLLQTYQCLTKALDVPFEKNELKDMFRLPAKAESPTSTIIMEFTNTWAKNSLIAALKKHRKSKSDQLSSKNIGFDGKPVPIYISERLMPKTKRLHYLSRELAKTEGYAHCWVTNGKVFLRKREGAPFIAVRNEDHLHSLRTQNAS